MNVNDDYRNHAPLERVQIGLKAGQEAYMADVIIARELDALACLASMVEEAAQRKLASVSFGYPTPPEKHSNQTELPPLFNSYYNQIACVRESLKRIQEFIASVQISEP